MKRAICAAAILFVSFGDAWAGSAYQQPPKHILDVLRAPFPPYAAVSPTRDMLLLITYVPYPPISDLSRPYLRLAGVRLLPRSRARYNQPYFTDFKLVKIVGGTSRPIALPPNARPGVPEWSADGKRFAFENRASDADELWMGEASTGAIRKVPGVRLNGVLENALTWMPDQKTLLVKLVPRGQGAPPPESVTPAGPDVQDASGGKGASSTYEVKDVLKSPRDEDLFEHYSTSQLALVDAASGRVTSIGKPAAYSEVAPAPDGRHLLVQSIHRPYSYLTTWERFPTEIEVWDRGGKLVRKLASVPLADAVPIWGVPTGPRDFAWRANEPATLTWAESLDGGDWKTQVPHRDRVLMARAPFDAEPVEVLRTEQRFTTFRWGEKKELAFVTEVDLIKHWTRTFAVDVDQPKIPPRPIWSHSTDERYKHPGSPLVRQLPNGAKVMEQRGDSIFLAGTGSTPEGDRPFLDELDLGTLKTKRLFRSDKQRLERPAVLIDAAAGTFLTRRESPSDPPNYFVRTPGKAIESAADGEATLESAGQKITGYEDPAPQIRGITKRLVKYKRADGVDLSFQLFLPPGYKEGTRLPTVVWAYPLDYADPQMAGQVAGSTQKFTVLGWPLQLFLLLDGYAVIDNPSLPVVGDTNKIYDTYMEQLVAGAKAAVDKAVELGVADPERIGVTGHSHGGLMTVNLLANSDLFRAGVARSGAYNRSLTAFGFQNERRTLWEAPEVYTKVSPFFHAEKIKLPLLLIHGEADSNPGTVPLQSEKLYEAVRGNGGTVRLVMLPFEDHGYRSIESTQHVLYEMLAWFEKYVKNAPPRTRTASVH